MRVNIRCSVIWQTARVCGLRGRHLRQITAGRGLGCNNSTKSGPSSKSYGTGDLIY
jgi:hypothetical protein